VEVGWREHVVAVEGDVLDLEGGSERLTIVGSGDKIRAELDWTPRIPLADSLRAMSLSLR